MMSRVVMGFSEVKSLSFTKWVRTSDGTNPGIYSACL